MCRRVGIFLELNYLITSQEFMLSHVPSTPYSIYNVDYSGGVDYKINHLEHCYALLCFASSISFYISCFTTRSHTTYVWCRQCGMMKIVLFRSPVLCRQRILLDPCYLLIELPYLYQSTSLVLYLRISISAFIL